MTRFTSTLATRMRWSYFGGGQVKKLALRVTSPRLQVWISGVALACWIVLWPITMGSRLATSLSWLTNASLFANVGTCFGWWVTSLVQLRTERIEASSTQAATLAHIEAMEQRILDRLEGSTNGQ